MVERGQQLEVRVHLARGATVVSVAGEVDMATVALMREPLLDAVRGGTGGPIVADLTSVAFLSSAGLALLAEAHGVAAAGGGELRIVAASRPILRPLQTTGLTTALNVYASLDDAVDG